MFGFSKSREEKTAPPLEGVAEFVYCVFDDKHRLQHHFHTFREHSGDPEYFRFLNNPEQAFESCVMREAVETRRPVSFAVAYSDGKRKHLAVLPYERKRGKWRFSCIQVMLDPVETDAAAAGCESALAEERICLMLVDAEGMILVTGPRIPRAFGFSDSNLPGMHLSDLFSGNDIGVMTACSPDSGEVIRSCVLYCLDGSRRDVEILKFSSADSCTLYAVCDVTPPQFTEEVAQVGIRERRRIGQDLHDSLGQLLTGISLLSRSLANSLRRTGHSAEADAAQISDLADDASNQIRQISRGLMPSEIVQKGLFDSLRDLAKTTTSSCGLLCVARLDETVEFADGAVETHLYRIAQEAVNNAVRHAQASRIDILLVHVNGAPCLEVCDNGTWKGTDDYRGMGMKTMEYRASAIGARFRAGAHREGGTRVTCVLEAEELSTARI